MRAQGSNYLFHGQKIYIGIDVHLKTWSVAILVSSGYKEEFSQEGDPAILYSHLSKKYPGGYYYSVYESGFTGFSTHRSLMKYGINNIIVNASDVPTTQKERVQKTDKVDALKLALSLRDEKLKGIYIPNDQELEFRELVRYRKTLVEDSSRWKNRIKSYLYRTGISYPKQFLTRGSHWSRNFIQWLQEISSQADERILLEYIDSYLQVKKSVLQATQRIRKICQEDTYAKNIKLLTSVPGIGTIAAFTFLSEIGNITRFKNEKSLAGYIGIVPMSHDSGDKSPKMEMTFRGNRHLRCLLIEASWVAIRMDRALAASYGKLVQSKQPNDAIIRIARKLSNRILSVLKTGKEYVNDKNDQQ